MKSVEQVIKFDLFPLAHILLLVGSLLEKTRQLESGDVIRFEAHCRQVVLHTYVYMTYVRLPIRHECSFQYKFVILHSIIVFIDLQIQSQMALLTPDHKSLTKSSQRHYT